MKMLSFRHLWEAYINLLYMYLMVVDGANANNCQLYFIYTASNQILEVGMAWEQG